MKILVCVSHVPDTTSKITFTDNDTVFNTVGIQYIINPYDEIALARAVELTGDGKGSITVIHVGQAAAEPTLRKALAIGADEAVRVDATPRDAWFVANQIAAFAKTQAFDLILTGRESIDYNGTQVQGYVAELLDIPLVAIAKSIAIEGKQALIEREIEGGKERIELPLPAVIGAAEGVAEPKIPNMRGIMGARSKPLQVIEAMDVPQRSRITHYTIPEPRIAVKFIDKDQVEQLVALLHSEAKVI